VPGAEWTLIEAGVFVDGTGRPPLQNVGVLVQGQTIREVGPIGSLPLPTDATVQTVDARAGTLIPGMVDAHFHLGYCGHRSIQEIEWPVSLEYSAIRGVGNMDLALRCGFTSALDVGSRGQVGVAMKQALHEGHVRGPRLRVSGQIITTTSGCVDIWPEWIEMAPHARLGVVVRGADDVREVVRRQVKSGVDNVKVEASGTGVHPLRPALEVSLSLEELTTAVQVAHEYGVSVAAHAERIRGVKNAIRAGVDTVQHATFMDDEAIDLLENHPTSRVVFTTGVYDGIIQIGPSIGYPSAARDRFAAAWPEIVGTVRRVYERGIPFAAGSDCGGQSHPHGRYARNVTLFVRECGIPVERAIQAVTSRAAEAAWFEQTGSVEPGRMADLVVVRGDLTQHVEVIEDESAIEVVMQAGRLVKGVAAERVPAYA
jgi:imidazolonepropionase-like amidohydrolase